MLKVIRLHKNVKSKKVLDKIGIFKQIIEQNFQTFDKIEYNEEN